MARRVAGEAFARYYAATVSAGVGAGRWRGGKLSWSSEEHHVGVASLQIDSRRGRWQGRRWRRLARGMHDGGLLELLPGALDLYYDDAENERVRREVVQLRGLGADRHGGESQLALAALPVRHDLPTRREGLSCTLVQCAPVAAGRASALRWSSEASSLPVSRSTSRRSSEWSASERCALHRGHGELHDGGFKRATRQRAMAFLNVLDAALAVAQFEFDQIVADKDSRVLRVHMVFSIAGETVLLLRRLLQLRVDVVACRMLVLHWLLAVLVLLLLCIEGGLVSSAGRFFAVVVELAYLMVFIEFKVPAALSGGWE